MCPFFCCLQVAHTIHNDGSPIHPALVVNMDQAGICLVPVGKRTWAAKGQKAIKLLGADDKRQLTVCVASAADGTMLPLLAIFLVRMLAGCTCADACVCVMTVRAQMHLRTYS